MAFPGLLRQNIPRRDAVFADFFISFLLCVRCASAVQAPNRIFMRIFPLSIGLLYIVAVGCAAGSEKSPSSDRSQQQQSKSGVVIDYQSLVKSLRARGADATAVGEVDQPFFSIKGLMIKVHGEDVQVFQYANAAAAEAEAAPISHDGVAVGTRKIFWVGPPHFFRQGRLLVLYVGSDDKVLKSLGAVLGRQFAGQ